MSTIEKTNGEYRLIRVEHEHSTLWIIQVKRWLGWHTVKEFASDVFDDNTLVGEPLTDENRMFFSVQHISAIELYDNLTND